MNPSEVNGFGLDLGSTTAKFVHVEQGRILESGISPSHRWKEFVSSRIPEEADDVYTTGYFRRSFPHKKAVTEITAAKAGTALLYPDRDVDVILDIGGQDTKVIELKTNRFTLNDKCSAGTGAFLEFTAKYFDLELSELGRLHEEAKDPVNINNTCGVFAISEMISHLVKGASTADVVAGMHKAWARRIVQLLPGEFGCLVVIGGGARNTGILTSLGTELGGGAELVVPHDPDLVNALGAVVYGCTGPGT